MSYISEFSVEVSQIVFSAHLTVLRLVTTLWEKNFKNLISNVSSVHKYHKLCSELIWPFYGLLQLYELKTSKMSYVREFSPQVSQIVFSAQLTVFTNCNNIVNINFKNLISQVVE